MSDLHNQQAERACLGAAMIHAGAFEAMGLTPSDFFLPVHRAIWAAMESLRKKDRPVDPVTVLEELRFQGEKGDPTFLVQVMDEGPIRDMVEWHAAIVLRDSARRRLAIWAADVGHAVKTREEVGELIAESRQRLEEIETRTEGGPVRVGDRIGQVLEVVEAKKDKPWEHSVPTGIRDFDRVFGGLRPGRLVVVAARPGIGKTSLVKSICLHAAVSHAVPTLLFSLEMTFQEMAEQFIAAHTRIPTERVDRGDLNRDDFGRIFELHGALGKAPLYVDERVLTAAQISSTARTWRARHPESKQVLVAIDYLGLIRSTGRSETRALEVGRMAWAAKVLAKDLSCPVVLVSQLNREIEKRGGEPLLADLRDSGEIEQHAHTVIFPHREPPLDQSGPAKIIVAKNRSGRTGLVGAHWHAEFMMFSGLAAEPQEERRWNDQ